MKNFKDPKASRDLNYAILSKEFGLKMEIPLHFLIPPIPNRLDYILHIEDLLRPMGDKQNNREYKDGKHPPANEERESLEDGHVFGIDIGTGASCIYPLLGAKLHRNWSFLAVDVNKESLEYAMDNVKRNNLTDQINLVRNKSKHILAKRILGDRKYDFLMCNPPFYSSIKEIYELRDKKDKEPFGICTGSSNEMITPGGELEFIKKIINESIKRKKQIKWFTTLVGVKNHAYELKELIEGLDESVECRLNSFRHGLTTRWVLSWKFNIHKRKNSEA